jgi:hypothetical protein
MANYAIFGGAGYFTAQTLGNLLTVDNIRVVQKRVKVTGFGFLFSQAASGASREFGVFFDGTQLMYNYGSSSNRVMLTSGEVTSIFGSAKIECDLFDIRFNNTAVTVDLYINNALVKSTALVKGATRVDGMLFRVGARSNSDSPASTTGGVILPAGSWIGDTTVYINNVVVRNYVMPSTGTTVPDTVSGMALTQRGTWPSDDSEWGSYGDVQDFTIDQTTVKPSDTISGTYAGWPDAPTATVTLADSASNTLTLVASVTGGAGSGTWSATIPSLPSVGANVDFLKFGATTVSFGGFTAKSGPTLQVSTTQTLATLAADYDPYVFQDWSPLPQAGDQLITNTLEGIFNSNGDYTFYAEGVYPVWYINSDSVVYGLTVDTSGAGVEPPEPSTSTMLKPTLKPVLSNVITSVFGG